MFFGCLLISCISCFCLFCVCMFSVFKQFWLGMKNGIWYLKVMFAAVVTTVSIIVEFISVVSLYVTVVFTCQLISS